MRQEDYRVFNAKVKYAWRKDKMKYTAFVDLNNVFDERYSAHGTIDTNENRETVYPSVEFNIFAGLRFNY